MAEIRLSKIARQFNIGVGTLVDFLNGKGADITTSDPNAKISDEFMPAVEAKFGGSNNYAKSALAKHLNSTFLEALTENHAEEVLLREVDLTAVNGSTEYGLLMCKVAPLTIDEYRRLRDIIPLPESWECIATPWSTPAVNEDDTWVAGLVADGNVYSSHNNSGGLSPPLLWLSFALCFFSAT